MFLLEFLQDILAAIGVVLNGIPQGLLALSYGFASVPTALGFAIGAVGCGVLNSVAPISFQAETIVMAGNMGKTRRDRLSMVMFGGLIMVVLGLTGALSAITAFAGDAIVHAMMAGVGFVLVRTAFNMVKENQMVGWVSVASAVVIYLITKALDPGNALVYTIVGSLIISSVAAKLAGQKLGENTVAEKMCRLRLEKPVVNLSVIRGALSLACLTIGANIAFGNITSGMGTAELNVDHLTVYSGLADAVSSLFGGGPVEAIISATGAAPHAVLDVYKRQAFYSVITAVRNVVKFRKQNSPVLSAAKGINLASALVSMLALETAMLSQFGSEESPVFRRVMNSATGGAVCCVVLGMAVYMMVRATQNLKRLEQQPAADGRCGII